ncbi:hypothetical protein L3X38_020687 [Prunus dulcis]|uniref:Uncharacterized protein n=1 Tax=Prunus dulcis TaxID=3755 RepID=A0AAD4WE89_PRUDU|nr:hypothetical protein L3X38_020687 [Prunus dulcis]
MNLPARFSKTMPSEAAKKASTWVMKCFSPGVRVSQWRRSWQRSTSSAVQKEASAFLYISQISGYWIGNIQKRSGFGASNGSSGKAGIFMTRKISEIQIIEEI